MAKLLQNYRTYAQNPKNSYKVWAIWFVVSVLFNLLWYSDIWLPRLLHTSPIYWGYAKSMVMLIIMFAVLGIWLSLKATVYMLNLTIFVIISLLLNYWFEGQESVVGILLTAISAVIFIFTASVSRSRLTKNPSGILRQYESTWQQYAISWTLLFSISFFYFGLKLI
ncbi:hypothetical protein MF271_22640 (plasmid) [Deinococcus sp. KNUC1210]|uniref:hypothetical protein n=1 Tax=Deinococcus sp. KNUC1210 TaxID=2917691 RepID=UPI001EF033EC|nr:hypothetical protein [Deinococcus sp. KNUC1210]ULH18266.1 hypothetical protein MF271_22640 [Deinococcus sp. KNUC1210]